MKRALVLTFAALLFGVAGLAQISGSFSGEISLLPKLELDSIKLEIGYTVAGFDIKGTSEFDSTGFISQEFSLTGAFGPVNVEGEIEFLPTEEVLKDTKYVYKDAVAPYTLADWYGLTGTAPYTLLIREEKWVVPGPAYKSMSLTTSMDFAGVSLSLEVSHTLNKILTFSISELAACEIIYGRFFDYTVQTDSTTATWTGTVGSRYLWNDSSCCMNKFFWFSDWDKFEMKATNVIIKGVKGIPAGETVRSDDLVKCEVPVPLELAYYDASTGDLDLTRGAWEYLWTIFIDKLVGAEGWLDDVNDDGWIDVGIYTSEADLDADLINGVIDWGVLVDPTALELLVWMPSYMTYTFTVENDIFGIEVIFDDVCTGMQFKEATITLTDLSLCCGITYDAELHFTKCEGFDYAKFSADLFEICCDISFGMDLEFGVDYKKVAPKFSWAGIENCITIWGDVQAKEKPEIGIEGWELYGFKVHCELAECTYIEFVEAFNVDKVEEILDENIFEAAKGENEYLKFGFCGPGCCGGTWSLDTSVFFSAEVDPTLFGITRFLVETEVPLMDALSVSLDFGYNVPDTETTLIFGWTFTF